MRTLAKIISISVVPVNTSYTGYPFVEALMKPKPNK